MLRFARLLLSIIGVACYAGEAPVLVITGASRGIGLATAEHFAQRGWSVYGTVRHPVEEKSNLHFLPLDLTDRQAIHLAIQKILGQEGKIDLLINNAGYAIAGPIESFSDQELQEQFAINLFAPVQMIQAVLPSMRQRCAGHIINISSTNAFDTCPFGAPYAASKAALESFSEALAVEVHPYNIGVTIVEPGLLTTKFSIQFGSRAIDNDSYQHVVAAIRKSVQERTAHPELLSPSQSPEEIAAILFELAQQPSPPLRMQTSPEAAHDVAKKLLDLTGELFLKKHTE